MLIICTIFYELQNLQEECCSWRICLKNNMVVGNLTSSKEYQPYFKMVPIKSLILGEIDIVHTMIIIQLIKNNT